MIGEAASRDRKSRSYFAARRRHLADRAVAALEKSAEEGVRGVTSQTIESVDDGGKLGLTAKGVTSRVRKDAGDPRFLEVALKALREIRDLFGIGAEGEGKLKAASPESGRALEALVRTGAARVTTRWRVEGR